MQDRKAPKTAFIAAGIGITPLLAQLTSSSSSPSKPIHILWTLHLSDIGLLADILPRIPALLRPYTRIFVTGTQSDSADEEGLKRLQEVEREYKGSGVVIETRRLGSDDVKGLEEVSGGREDSGKGMEEKKVEKWIVCAAPGMRREVQGWLGGRTVLYENFDY
ncbi:hypothetical protein ES702_01469 [subsurface metagenome]